MKQFGQVVLLGITTEPLNIPYLPFIIKELSFHGSVSSNIEEGQATLDFAAANGVRPLVEEFPMNEEGIATAVERLQSGKIRYRAVLKV
jgi:D-arabinose 1-dehydrogenase-like Zn-dependent alcohol dehydrogenase